MEPTKSGTVTSMSLVFFYACIDSGCSPAFFYACVPSEYPKPGIHSWIPQLIPGLDNTS